MNYLRKEKINLMKKLLKSNTNNKFIVMEEENITNTFIFSFLLFSIVFSTTFIESYWFIKSLIQPQFNNQNLINQDNQDNQDNQCALENQDDSNNRTNNPSNNKITKYEDKYIDIIRKTDKDYVFTEDEKREIEETIQSYSSEKISSYEKQIKELTTILENTKKEIDVLLKMSNSEYLEKYSNDRYDNYDEDEENITPLNKDEHIIHKYDLWEKLEKEIAGLEMNMNDKETINTESQIYSRNKIIEKKLDKLNGCFVMESTPLGNVLMKYNKERSTFSYYSDNTIPYRYLEVVARKFVKTFHCRSLFIDMEEELKNSEKKMEEEKRRQEFLNSEDNRKDKTDKTDKTDKPNKNVFAKLKNYNKPSGRVNSAPPPKSSIPNNSVPKSDNLLLKESSNRYTYEGKLSTFNMLKKVEKKVINKKLGLTFSDFKRLSK